MNTTNTNYKNIAAALMFLLLAVFLMDNPIKGSLEDANGHQDMALYMIFFYLIVSFWFMSFLKWDQKTKSNFFIIVGIIGVMGCLGQLILYNADIKEYHDAFEDAIENRRYDDGPNWDFEIYEETYPIKKLAWGGILAGCAFAS